LLLNEYLFLQAYISLSTQSGNFWTHPCNMYACNLCINVVHLLYVSVYVCISGITSSE